jgi:hypothetical protein
MLAVQIARGQVPGRRPVLRTGINFDIDTGMGLVSLWDFGGRYVFPPAASVMTVSSSSAADTAAGTGARTVLVTGLDSSYAEISEVITLNGLTAVPTVNQFLRVFGLTVLTAGSGGEAAGNLYIGTGVVTAGVPAVVYGHVRIGWGTSQMAQYTVPAGHTAYLLDLITSAISSAVNQNTLLSIMARPFGGVFLRGGSLVISGGLAYLENDVPRSFPERTDIDAVASTSDQNVIATVSARFLLIENDLGD